MGGFDWLVKKCIIIDCVAGPEAVATIGGFVTGGAWRALGGVFCILLRRAVRRTGGSGMKVFFQRRSGRCGASTHRRRPSVRRWSGLNAEYGGAKKTAVRGDAS